MLQYYEKYRKYKVLSKNWLVNQGPSTFICLLVTVSQISIFAFTYSNFQSSNTYGSAKLLLGSSLAIAKAAAKVLNASFALILFPICRRLLFLISTRATTAAQKYIPFDQSMMFHYIIGISTIFWTLVHVCAHFINYLHYHRNVDQSVSPEHLSMLSGPGWTGQFMIVILFLMVTSSTSKIRAQSYRLFIALHHLYIPFFALFLAHGAFCFVKADVGPKCGSLPDFWKFWILSGIIFIIEKVVREQWIDRILSLLSNSPLTQFEIITVIQHPSKVIEIRMCKPPNIAANVDYFHCGQYIFLNVPELSRFEWHPFTLTSAPEDKYISCHIRVCGEWTEKLSTRLGCMWSTPPALTTTTTDSKPGLLPLVSEPTIVGQKAREMLPIIRMDGPYGSIRDDMFNRKVCVMIGAGIGVTPFSSTLKSLWHRVVKPKRVIPLQKVYFVWICRDKENFEWFHQLIAAIESQMVDATSGHASHFSRFLDIRIHLTGQIKDIGLIQNIYMNTDHTSYSISNNNNTSQTDGLTGLRSLTYFGRPQFDKFFEEVSLAHPKTNVGVFYCGSDALGSTIQRQCHKSGGDHGTVFHFKHETF